MKLFNKGHRRIDHPESHKPGSACVPQKVFSVSDALGEKLKKMYPKELENLDDVTAKFSEKVPEQAEKEKMVATPEMSGQSISEIAEQEEAASLGVSIDDLRNLKS